jgi:hypothetical protein
VTRALGLALEGRVGASLRMHPLAMPAAVAVAFVVVATVRAAWIEGTPSGAFGSPAARASLRVAGVVYAAMVAIWIARAFGALGGPVSV